jgi:hypothetical protein
VKNLYKIAETYNIKIHEIIKGDSYCKSMGEDWYKNSSYIAGKEIYLGIYDDDELKIISFFHELGHSLTPPYKNEHSYKISKYEFEKIAWKIGLKKAKNHNYSFSFKSLRWAVKQLQSYIEYEKREMTPEGYSKMKFGTGVWKKYLI